MNDASPPDPKKDPADLPPEVAAIRGGAAVPPSRHPQTGTAAAFAETDDLPVTSPRLPDSIVRQADAIAAYFAPAYVVIDTQFEVLQFSGPIAQFLEPRAGAAPLSLIRLVHPDLRGALEAALYRAISQARRVELSRQLIRPDEQASYVNIVIEPLSLDHVTTLVVIFRNVGPAEAESEHAGPYDDVLRQENEVPLSADQLQAAPEELLSSKKELQSVNEGLQTVNQELGHQIRDLARSNSDIRNLLEASQIATIFFDKEFRLRSFTASASDLFPQLETGVGHPLDHLAARLSYPEIHEDVKQVLQSQIPVERKVSDTAGTRDYAVKVLPCRSIDDYIGGTVLTFTDITATRHAESALQDSAARLHSLMEGLPQLFWRADARGSWTWVSPQWTTCTGQPLESAMGEGWQEQAHPDDLDALRKAWAAAAGAAETQGFAADFRLMDATEGGWRWFRTRATAVRDRDWKIIEWLGISTDVNELLGLQEQQRALVGELQHRTRNLLSVVRQVSQRTLKSARDLGDFGQRFRDRLEMLARVQGLLSDLDGNSGLGFDALVQAALSAVGADSGEGLSLEGPADVSLRPSAVQLLSMALHELATNAVQHGALGSAAGHLHIGWQIEGKDPSRLHILWRETGVAMPGAEPAWGQGRELIERALPYQLDAVTTFRTGPDGILCTISLPI